MKQELMKGKQRVKGTVLVTVVTVMLVMVLFLMSTLILTTSANRRSYYSYYQTQAQYAAQAALDAITNNAYSDKTFSDWVNTSVTDAAGAQEIIVSFENSNMPLQDETVPDRSVRCTIEKVSENYVYDTKTNRIYEQPAWKLTATAVVGAGRNRSEYTLTNYIYSNVIDDSVTGTSNLVTWDEYDYTESQEDDDDSTIIPGKPASIANAVYSLGVSGSTDNFTTLGPQYSGMRNIPTGRIKYEGPGALKLDMSNDNVVVGNGCYVGNLATAVTSNITFQNKGEGARFYGDLLFTNKGTCFEPKYSTDQVAKSGATWDYRQVNYLYVDGTIAGDNFGVGYSSYGTRASMPCNLFAGAVVAYGQNRGMSVHGDAYLYDAGMSSQWYGGSTTTYLYDFINNFITKSAKCKSALKDSGGNLVCNNYLLKMGVPITGADPDSATRSDMVINGDFIFSNPSGYIELNGNLKVNGTAYVACPSDHVISRNTHGSTINATGGVFYGADAVTALKAADNGFEKDGTEYYYGVKRTFDNDGNVTKTEKLKLAEYETEANKITYTVKNHAGTNVKYKAADVTVTCNFELIPFAYRQDEIFDKYYRWDLAGDNETNVTTAMNNDPLVKESKACGHIWQVATFNEKKLIDDPDPTHTEEYTLVIENRYYPQGTPGYDPSKPINVPDPNKNEGYQTLTRRKKIETTVKHYAPYTTPVESTHAFIEGFEPVYASDAVITASNGSASAINSLLTWSSFTSKSSGTQYLTKDQVDGLLKADGIEFYSAPYGNGNQPVQYKTFGDTPNVKKAIYYVNKSCDINVSHLPKDSILFIDPSTASSGLYISLTGTLNTGIEIVVNNTADYGPGGTNPQVYGKDLTTKYAGRKDVYLFLRDSFKFCQSAPNFITCTGAYDSMKNKSFNVVSNPLYPDKTGYSALTGAEKWKFMLVPNLVVIGEKGAKYTMPQSGFINADVIMPYSEIKSDTTSFQASAVYREFHDSPTVSGGNKQIMSLGSILAEKLSGSNLPVAIYIGDTNRAATTNTEKKWVVNDDPHTNQHQNGGPLEENDYFNKDHQAAG